MSDHRDFKLETPGLHAGQEPDSDHVERSKTKQSPIGVSKDSITLL